MEFFKDAQKVFFIGIGGIGMSALARLFRAHGKEVLGSDSTEDTLTLELKAEGVQVLIGHNEANLPRDVDLVIHTEAIPLGNPELELAHSWGVPTMTYFQALGYAADSYRLVAIAGSHGKTTTVAMLSLILIEAGYDPTVVIGSKLQEFGNSNLRVGSSDIMVVEACEYRRNFLHLKPDLLGILNIDLDHVDFFDGWDDYEAAFEELAEQSDEVVWPDEYSEYDGELSVPGWHNLMNAGMAAALARRLGVDEDVIANALFNFAGTWRRFEYKGTLNGALVYDDYAHHPTEIIATLEAAREKHPEARLVAVFQPHQYSRTAGLMDGFAQAFEEADEVIIPNIYEVRDQDSDKEAGSAEKLVAEISKYHDNVRFGDGFDKTANYLRDSVGPGDLVLVMGAGDVTHMVPMILDEDAIGMA